MMYEAFKVFILSTIIITLWTAFLLLQDKRGNTLLNRWFAAFLIALTMPQLDLYITQIMPGGILTVSLVASSFLWLKGPFVWTFIQVLTRKKIQGRNHSVHFLPWLCVLIILLNFPQMGLICMLLGMCHMLTYLLVSIRQLVKMRVYLADVWHGFQNSAYYWLLYVIGGVMVLVAVDFVVMSLVVSGILSTYDLLDYFVFPGFSVYVLSVGILSVYRPDFFFRQIEPLVNDAEPLAVVEPLALKDEPKNETKERHLELDADIASNLMQQLASLMQDEHIYRQNDLALPDLATRLGISVNQVSELLNVHAGLSFYDYLNSYRLQYACNLLATPDCHLRILDVAFEAGYNNKNSFYRAFKDNLGFTPSEYRQNALAESVVQRSSVAEI